MLSFLDYSMMVFDTITKRFTTVTDSSDEDWAASASCEDPPKEKGNLEAFVRSDSFASVRSGLDRKKRQVDDKVCCKEANIQPSCSDIESTHR